MTQNNSKRTLMLFMGVLVFIGFGLAKLYYSYQDKGIDPRILEARKMYAQYDTYAQNSNYKKIFSLLDSIENIYALIPHYSDSYEIGVLYNNRAAAFISMAIYYTENSISLDGINTLTKDTLLFLGETASNKCIKIYTNWLKQYENLSKQETLNFLQTNFSDGLSHYSKKQQKHFIKTRAKTIIEAQFETPRRLSVAYTNRGIIKRHHKDYEGAVADYKKAIELWDRNLAAQNNLNILLGLPLKKQRFIDKVLPPDKSN